MKTNNIKYISFLILSFGFTIINAATEPAAKYNFTIQTLGMLGINQFEVNITTDANVNQLKEEISQRIGIPRDNFYILNVEIPGGALKNGHLLSSYFANFTDPLEIFIISKDEPLWQFNG